MSVLPREGFAHNAKSDIANSEGRAVIAVSGRHTLECVPLIESTSAHDGEAGGKAVERIYELGVSAAVRPLSYAGEWPAHGAAGTAG